MSSVMVATALAALIVLGVLAVLIFSVRGAETAFSQAAMAVSVAEVTEDGIITTTALQRERALGSLLAHDSVSEYLNDYRQAITETDTAIRELQVTWSRHRAEIPETVTTPISDVLAAEASLGEIREATQTPTVESTFDLYTELVTTALAATSDLVTSGEEEPASQNSPLVVALLIASEAMQSQRYLVQESLAAGGSMPEEVRLQLELVSSNLTQSLFEARSLADGEDFEAVQQIMNGPEAEAARQMLAGITASESGSPEFTPEQWYETSSARIELVDELIPSVSTNQTALARDSLDRAQRTLWSRSILLGALFVLSILVASNAVFATRERGEALAEYGQLTEGLRQWFVAASFPDADNVDVAARYVPASVRTMSGGDWYDVYQVGDDLALVIGDIAGHGAEATAQMAQLRNILRGQSTARPLEPAAQIDMLSRTVSHSGIMATLTYGLLDPAAGTFSYTRAGHIPLLIRSASGSIRIEEEAPGPPVGAGIDKTRGQHLTRLQPGDILILITDGLVEGVSRDIDLGLDEIAKTLTEAGPSTDDMLDRLFSISPGQTSDDAAALMITWHGPTPVG
jgi:hypothetical protein